MILLGEAEALEETSREVALTCAVALVVVFLVLTAQLESLMSAAVIMATVPFGLAATVLAMFLTGTSLNIYSQIGLVMLIGIMAKNGILVVEFADQLRDRGLAVREAIETAAKVRLRPIVMTRACGRVTRRTPERIRFISWCVVSSRPGTASRPAARCRPMSRADGARRQRSPPERRRACPGRSCT